jgi:hypothetical protein
MRGRTRDDALETLNDVDPVWLSRLIIVQDAMLETKETLDAQTWRRYEAVYKLIEAGASYADIARILDVTNERIRQMVAKYLDVEVAQLNPANREPAADRH